tara:strand:- start:722 stop:952 length:231 start_codon:yes stop_codon:yes gene_type:complete
MKQVISTAEVQALKKEGFTDELIANNFAVKISRNHTFSQEDVQQHAINVLAVISKCKKSQRDRILRHAIKMNEVTR